MALSPKLIRPAIALITGLITSTSVSFVGLALNYGFQPDFAVRWLKAAATSYVVIVPVLMIVIVTTIDVYLAVYKGVELSDFDAEPDRRKSTEPFWRKWFPRRKAAEAAKAAQTGVTSDAE